MNNWVMNTVFKGTASLARRSKLVQTEQVIGLKSVQTSLLADLRALENDQLNTFENIHSEYMAKDPLDKAASRAMSNLERGTVSIAEYYRVKHKMQDVKKIRFAEDYDGYKVATSTGGTKTRELHQLHTQLDKNERGELAHKLWKERKETDPAAKGPIGYL
mmetsp:Transcript_20628/g.18272  ORF Transcript_20628/g.18272 Transcript_20628/m.18272 type:complete len:161 (+) Transcript_20628:18-500(+)